MADANGIKELGDYLAVLQLAFPNATKMVTNFTDALKNGQGVIAAFKGGLSGLWEVIAAHPIMTAIAAVGLLVTIVNKVTSAAKEAREAAIEAGNAAKDECENIEELYSAYREAATAYQNGSGTKDAYTSATETLCKALGMEESEVGTLISKYDELDNKIRQNTVDKLKEKLQELTDGYAAAKEELVDTASHQGLFGSQSLFGTYVKYDMDKESQKVVQALEDYEGFHDTFSYGLNG